MDDFACAGFGRAASRALFDPHFSLSPDHWPGEKAVRVTPRVVEQVTMASSGGTG
jgi:hypothetical protein